ncbi:MAG TPA: DCC1-like thiol-disulfide oxidoreductase family protein [Ignavibacteria bacterium]
MDYNYSLILFDGVCNFCNSSVNFIIRRDKKNIFRFASLQSETGQKCLSEFNFSQTEFDTIILIEKGELYTRSTAALRIAKSIRGIWKLFYIFIIIPRPIRNYFYDLLSRNRYKWFGKRYACRIPSEEEKNRFL